jgi:hypothetical protein
VGEFRIKTEVKCQWIAALCHSGSTRESGKLPGAMGGPVGGRILVSSTKQSRLLDAYRFPGFCPMDEVRGVFGDPNARIVTLVRRSKERRPARAKENIPDDTIASFVGLGTQFRCNAKILLNHAALHLNRATHRLNGAGELDQNAVTNRWS